MSSMQTSGAVDLRPASPVDRLSTLPDWPWDPLSKEAPRTAGYQVAGWLERWLTQPNGPRAGRRFQLTPGQLVFLLWWYAVDENGSWLFNHGVRRLAKGSGKSPYAAVLALAEFCGPVRPSEAVETVPGRAVSVPVDMPWVQIAATAESQTKNTMRMVRAFAPKKSRIVDEFNLDPGKTTYYKLPEGTLEVITSSASAAEGAEASFVVADETEHWTPGRGGPELAATLADNLAKSGSRMLETCNAWVPGQESVAEASWEGWLAQEEGRTRGRTKILYDAVLAPPDTDMADPDSLRGALGHVYGDCPWVDVDTIMERIWSPRSKPEDSRRKYLNRPTAAADAWVTPEEWQLLAAPDVEVDPDEPVVLFFDGSKSRDATALVGCRLDDGHVFTVGVWEPDPNDPDDTVPVGEVDMTVRQTMDRLDVVAFFADVREWEQFALTTWPQEYGDSLKVWASPQGRPPQAVAWDMRGHAYEFAKATEACHAEIVEGGFTHDGDSRVARHIANARRRPYRDALAIGKESPDSPRKIDAAVCVVGARMVRRMVLGSKKYKKRSGKAMFV
jgi:hypothetical protein